MDEITQDKLELLRIALPKGLSAGDSGLAGFPEKPFTQPMNWPQFQATTTDTKLYTGSPTVTETPQTIQPQQVQCALGLYTKESSVWVAAGTVAGELPAEFNAMDGKIISSGGSGNVWAKVNVNNEGSIVSVSVDGGGSTPSNTNTSFYYTLGYYKYSSDGVPILTNYGCGSLDVTVCRNWFAAEAPFYGVSFSRSGS